MVRLSKIKNWWATVSVGLICLKAPSKADVLACQESARGIFALYSSVHSGETTISYYLAWHKKVKNGDNNFFFPVSRYDKNSTSWGFDVARWLSIKQLNKLFFFFPTENTGTKEILSLTHNFSCPLSLCALDVVGNTRHMVLFPQLFRPRKAMFMNMSEGFGLGWLLRPRTAFQVQSYRKMTCDWPHT